MGLSFLVRIKMAGLEPVEMQQSGGLLLTEQAPGHTMIESSPVIHTQKSYTIRKKVDLRPGWGVLY